jgi:hypothetical protein
VTHRGQHQTFTSALPTLLKLARAPGKARMLLGCQGRAALHLVPAQAREIADLDWSVCPLDLLGSPHYQAVVQMDRMAKVAPLAGWPDRYAAWAVAGLMALRESRGE